MRRRALRRRYGHAAHKAVAELRHGGWSYKAVVRHWGSGTGTDYFRYDGRWVPIAWDQMPRSAYMALRARLKVDAHAARD